MIDLMYWYFSDLSNNNLDYEIVEIFSWKNKMLQFSIGSPSRTVKLIAIILKTVFEIDYLRDDIV